MSLSPVKKIRTIWKHMDFQGSSPTPVTEFGNDGKFLVAERFQWKANNACQNYQAKTRRSDPVAS